jgi:uncharacterized protein (DUF433 family)
MMGLEVEMVDWSKCSDVDRDPDRISGQWAVKGTRIPVQTVLDHAEAFSPEEMVDQLFPSLPLDRAKRIIAFAKPKAHAHSP